jgi:hypothetical protein
MTSLTGALLGTRSAETIAGAQNLFLQPGGITADAATAQLSALTPLSLLDSQPQAAAGDVSNSGGAEGPEAVASPLAVLDGHDAGGPQAGDAIISLGQSITDLGHANDRTLIAEAVNVPGEVTGLNQTSGNVAGALDDLGQTAVHAGTFVNAISQTVGEAGNQPVTTTANEVILDFHNLLEGATHQTGLTYVTHGITNLGETIGLGKIRQDNLLTDVLDLPGTALSGGDVLGSAGHLTGHLADITDAVSNIVTQIPLDLGSGPFGGGLIGQDGIVGGSGLDLANLGSVLGQDGGGPLGAVGGLVDNVTNGLDLVGSNASGGGNLVTDVLNLPGELLSGNGTPSLTDAGHQLDVALTATGDLVETVLHAGDGGLGSLPNGLLGTVTSALDSFGDSGGTALGLPLTLDGAAATTGALGLGGSGTDAGGLVASVAQTVNGALTDVGNDAALAGLGSGADLGVPSLVGGLADSLVGTLGNTGSPTEGGGTTGIALIQIEADQGLSVSLLSPVDPNQDHHSSTGLGHGLGLL